MKKNVFFLCFVVISLCLCLTLSIGILAFGPSQAGANEQLAEPPVLLTEEGTLNKEFLPQVSNWIRDHFFLRQELISIDHFLSARLFQTSGDAGVILGSDGWLYYTDTLDDYTGTNPMSERDLFAAAKNLSLMAQYIPEFLPDAAEEPVDKYKKLRRRITSFEYNAVLEESDRLGFDGYSQERTSATKKYTPDF